MYVCKHYIRVGGKLRFPGEVLEEGEAPEEALRRLLERGAIETVGGGDDGDPFRRFAPSPPEGEAGASDAEEDEEADGIADGIDPMAGIVGAPKRQKRKTGGRDVA